MRRQDIMMYIAVSVIAAATGYYFISAFWDVVRGIIDSI